MAGDYIRLEGQDLGIIAGGTGRVSPGAVFLYEPLNAFSHNPICHLNSF